MQVGQLSQNHNDICSAGHMCEVSQHDLTHAVVNAMNHNQCKVMKTKKACERPHCNSVCVVFVVAKQLFLCSTAAASPMIQLKPAKPMFANLTLFCPKGQNGEQELNFNLAILTICLVLQFSQRQVQVKEALKRKNHAFAKQTTIIHR